jgi:hypothetical protein
MRCANLLTTKNYLDALARRRESVSAYALSSFYFNQQASCLVSRSLNPSGRKLKHHARGLLKPATAVIRLAPVRMQAKRTNNNKSAFGRIAINDGCILGLLERSNKTQCLRRRGGRAY